jgi:hypothetical protein
LALFNLRCTSLLGMLGEPPGYYRQEHDLRPLKFVVVVVVVHQCSRLILHQVPSAVFIPSPLKHIFKLLLCMLQSFIAKLRLLKFLTFFMCSNIITYYVKKTGCSNRQFLRNKCTWCILLASKIA